MGWDAGEWGEGPAGHEESRQYLQGAEDLRAVWELGILLGVLPTLYRGKELARERHEEFISRELAAPVYR